VRIALDRERLFGMAHQRTRPPIHGRCFRPDADRIARRTVETSGRLIWQHCTAQSRRPAIRQSVLLASVTRRLSPRTSMLQRRRRSKDAASRLQCSATQKYSYHVVGLVVAARSSMPAGYAGKRRRRCLGCPHPTTHISKTIFCLTPSVPN
jgi:hypothetical protein